LYFDDLLVGAATGLYEHFENPSGTVSSNLKPALFKLEQNYPNPFNPVTVINYSIPKAGLVTIKVYDVLGREVKTLVNENKPAGNYNIEFNAGKFASGVYFYRMHSGNYLETKKFILMK
ncbi:MAG: T9SS type A sorting domain-containing protein, partial [Ignavibacteriaceae bacterium]|nr:T9SS type A sorting domain-containing protein [Ignavibacteriaceae bacterium]